MNALDAVITLVESNAQLSLVEAAVGEVLFSAIVLETALSNPLLKPGISVKLLFKEMEVSLAKHLTGELSLRNRFPVEVLAIEQGAILSAVKLSFQGQILNSVITTRSLLRMQIVVGEHIEALVKSNEIVIAS